MSAQAPDAARRMPFVTVTNWVRASRLCGIDIEAIFLQEGIDTRLLDPQTATIDRLAMQNVMQRCVAATQSCGSPLHFPLVLGDSFAFEYLSDVETYITTSSTLRDAARSLEWIPPLVNPFMRFSLAEHGPEARLSLHFEEGDAAPGVAGSFVESVFSSVLKFCRLLLGSHFPLGRITMRHAPHARSDAVQAHFQVPCEWGATLDALWFERNLLDWPLRGALPSLHEQVALRLQQRVQGRESEPLHASAAALTRDTACVAAIEEVLRRRPELLGQGLPALAVELGLHARTLQRRLKAAGESHSAIQARVRHGLARDWLAHSQSPIEDISARLGFTDRRSFTLAFSRWAGCTPSQYRRDCQLDTPARS